VNELVGHMLTWTSRSSSMLLVAVVEVLAAVSVVIVVSGRGWVSTTITFRVGPPVPCGPATQVTGGRRRGWPPQVLVRARGPPARGVGGRCRVPCPRVHLCSCS
jgi:hypothetical protein